MRVPPFLNFNDSIYKEVDYREVYPTAEYTPPRQIFITLYRISTCPHGQRADDVLKRIQTLFTQYVSVQTIALGSVGHVFFEADEDDVLIEHDEDSNSESVFRIGFRRYINDSTLDVVGSHVVLYSHRGRFVCPTTEFYAYTKDFKKRRVVDIYGIDDTGEVYEYILLFFMEIFGEIYNRKREREILSNKKNAKELSRIRKEIHDFYKK